MDSMSLVVTVECVYITATLAYYYSVSQISEPPKHFAITTAKLIRFK